MANLYEEQYDMYDVGKRRYSEATADMPPAPLPPRPNAPKVQVNTVREKKGRTFVPGIVLDGIIIIMLLVLLIQFNLTTEQKSVPEVLSPSINNASTQTYMNATSCKQHASQGRNKDGIYKIIPQSANIEEFQAYCDMTTDDGGWTLVASIRDSEITQKCSPDDLWSSYLSSATNYDIKTNWENEMVFGDVHRCTSEDYKNPGYYNIKAKDVMVWHVSEDTALSKTKQESSFRYRTNNTFLNSRSLKDLFQDYELTPRPDISKLYKERPLRVIQTLLNEQESIINKLQDFERYELHDTYVTGTKNAFSGNIHRVTFKSPGCKHKTITYGTSYSCDDGYTNLNTSSNTNDLFFAIAAISNDDKSKTYFTIEVELQKYTTMPSYTYTKFNGSLTKDSHMMQYYAHQYFHVSYGCIVQLYFVVANKQEWGSEYQTPSVDVTNGQTSLHKAVFTVGSTPTNTMMGYTLLTRINNKKTTEEEIRNVATIILDGIISVDNLYKESTGYAVPVVFDAGNKNEFLNTVPEDLKSRVEPGFVQFRAYNFQGYANAFCPGIKTSTVMPQYVCIGGISDDIGKKGICGDFAGWEGKAGETPNSKDQALGHAHSENDLQSAILIFVR